jgi:hypothetical protein
MEVYRSGKLKHGYRVNPKPRNISEFQTIIEDSFAESSTFMNALLLTRFENDCFIRIDNMTFTESYGATSEEHSIENLAHLISLITDRFHIPESIVLESLDGFEMRKSGWEGDHLTYIHESED